MDKDMQICFDLTTKIMTKSLSDAREIYAKEQLLPDSTVEITSVAVALFNARFQLLMGQARDLQKQAGLRSLGLPVTG